MHDIEIIELNESNLTEHALCTITNSKHEGLRQKREWIKDRLEEGLKVKVLHSEKAGDVGMIEYIPGKYAWRTVNAEKYMFIHCIFIAKKGYQRKGYGNLLIQECINEAKEKKMHGVATIASKSAFLPEKRIFLKNDFKLIDTALPAYELLALKFGRYKEPSFPVDLAKRLDKYKKGLTIFTSKQCPFLVKVVQEVEQTAKENNIIPKIIEMKDHRDAQNSPIGYGCFGMIWNGKIIADHPISNGRFKNILKKMIV
jgi:L-amino acid N-acyltransferase YncA